LWKECIPWLYSKPEADECKGKSYMARTSEYWAASTYGAGSRLAYKTCRENSDAQMVMDRTDAFDGRLLEESAGRKSAGCHQ
jgi:hypothetical protein